MCNKVHFSFLMWKERKGWRATNTEIARDIRVEGVKTTRAEIKLQWVRFSLRWGNERAREVERSTWKYRHTSLSEKCMLTEEVSAREPHERLESPLCLNKVRWHSIKPSDRSDSGLQRNRTKNSMYGSGFMHMCFLWSYDQVSVGYIPSDYQPDFSQLFFAPWSDYAAFPIFLMRIIILQQYPRLRFRWWKPKWKTTQVSGSYQFNTCTPCVCVCVCVCARGFA